MLGIREQKKIHFEIPIGLEVLDLLNQWKFDYRNLIGEGIAIDINTLNQ